jgi:hypothetical protein
VRRG